MDAVLSALLWVVVMTVVFTFLGRVMRKMQTKRENQEIRK